MIILFKIGANVNNIYNSLPVPEITLCLRYKDIADVTAVL
jgi:hypothetical protein